MAQLESTLAQRVAELSQGPAVTSTTGTRTAVEALAVRVERLEELVRDLASAVMRP